MRYISIITGSELRLIMGVNYYIKSFVQCNVYFQDVYVNRVYSGKQTLKIDEGDLMPIGNDIGTAKYKIRRGLRTLIRKLLTKKFYPFALLRYEINLRLSSKNAIRNFLIDKAPCDFILFQEMGVAEYYFKHIDQIPNAKNIKTAIIIHSEDDYGRALTEAFKGYGNKDMQRRFSKMRDYVYQHIDKVVYIARKSYINSIVQPLNKRAFVYNGSPNIDLGAIKNATDVLQFVCVGSVTGNKGQDKILEAMKLMDNNHLKRLHMTFVGGGTMLNETINMASSLGLDNYVTFTGHRNDVAELLKDKDVFILPSRTEGLPMSAIEGMRAGLFLILSDTGGNAELCEEQCGYVCSRDPEDILAKMYDVMDNEVVTIAQKEHSHSRFEKLFSLESMAKGYESLLKSL